VVVCLKNGMSISSTVAKAVDRDAPGSNMTFWRERCKFQWYLGMKVSSYVEGVSLSIEIDLNSL